MCEARRPALAALRTAAVILIVAAIAVACGQASPSQLPAVSPTVTPLVPSAMPPDPTVGPDVADIRYTCGADPGFLPGLLDQRAIAETEAHPSAEALRAAIAQVGLDIDLLPDAGYWLVHRDAAQAQYLARGRGETLVEVSFEVVDGSWKLAGWGECSPMILLEGRSLATWTLEPAAPPPGPADTTFTALVTERACTGAQPMGGRLLPPLIAYQEAAVLVVFAAVPLQGDAFTCPGNPSTRVVVELREPLGDRQLLDAAFFPPAVPVAPAF